MNKQTQKDLIRIVKQNYKEIASHYNETRKKDLGLLWSELASYTKEAVSGDKVLDVGCGNGRLLEAFDSKDIRYLGIDDSAELLKFAREQKPGREFRQCNILELGKIPETDFDWVYSVAVFHHLPGYDLRLQALRQLKNKIKPGGRIIITVWNMWSDIWRKKNFRYLIIKFWLLGLIGKNRMDFGDILVDWKDAKGEAVSQRYYHAFRKSELKRLAAQAGMKMEKINKDSYNYYLVLSK